METHNYVQYSLTEELPGEQAQWLSEGLEGIRALLLSGNIIATELPASVDLEISETAPVIKCCKFDTLRQNHRIGRLCLSIIDLNNDAFIEIGRGLILADIFSARRIQTSIHNTSKR